MSIFNRYTVKPSFLPGGCVLCSLDRRQKPGQAQLLRSREYSCPLRLLCVLGLLPGLVNSSWNCVLWWMVQGHPFGSCGPKQNILLQNQKLCLFVGKSTRYDSVRVRVRKWGKSHPISRLVVAFDHS